MTRPFRLTAPVVPEHDLQAALADALRVLLHPEAVFTSWDLANGASAIEGARKKRRGCLPGWPDAGVFWDGKVALLELKRERGGVLSPTQRELHARLERAGHRVIVAHGVNEALLALEAAGAPLRGWT